VNSQTSTIDSSKINPDDVVNEYGDIIKSATYEMEIKYDKFGNWIKEKYSVIRNGKLTKQSDTTRTIKYIK
jgi:ribosome-binding protein aMBF1 (putative translation factor)